MGSKRFRRAAELFHAALARAAGERPGFVDQACGADESLRREVLGMLAAEERGERLLDTGRGPARALRAGSELVPGAAIGGYRILRRIAAGGMGVVYEAEQPHPRRRVALKVLHATLATPDARRRFAHEAEILGALDHPGIATVHAAGTHVGADGELPYIVMELVHGKPITGAVAERAAGMRERLELFARVCDAVHYAHTQGVVHRDLKPANVLVDERGCVRIVDFGVARATGADVLVSTLETASGVLVGTLAYMSPEQARGGGGVDQRTDVHALGVILYELVSGRLPYEVLGRTLPEALRALDRDEPSTLASIDPRLAGDLDVIAAKALAKEPARRYASAAELAEDVRRYLRDEPILARPPSRLYELGKFARRNRLVVGSVAAIVLALGVALAIAGAGLVRARDAEAAAREDAKAASALGDYVITTLASVDPLGYFIPAGETLGPAMGGGGAAPVAREGQPDMAAFLKRAIEGIDAHFQGDRVRQAQLRVALGRACWGYGLFDDAEREVRHGLQMLRAELGPDDPALAAPMIVLAWVLEVTPRKEEILRLADEAQGLLERTLEPGDRETLAARVWSAYYWLNFGSSEGAVARADGLVETVERHLGRRDSVTMFALVVHSGVLREGGRVDEAVARAREAVELARELDPLRAEAALLSEGYSLGEAGRWKEAAASFQQASLILRRIAGEDHPWANRLRCYEANALLNLGSYERAAELYADLVPRICERVGDAHPWAAERLVEQAYTLRHLGQDEEALELALRCRAFLETEEAATHDATRFILGELGVSLTGADRAAEAIPFLRQHHELLLRMRGPDHPETVGAADQLARALDTLGSGEGQVPAGDR